MEAQDNIIKYIEQTLRDNWNLEAFTNFHGTTYLYRDVARKIAKIHIMFRKAGIAKGDRVAFCGANSAEWAVAFLASLTYGTVSVPILNDFKPETIHHLVNHSGARVLFTDAHIWSKLSPDDMPELVAVVLNTDYSLLLSRSKSIDRARSNLNKYFGEEYPERFTAADISYCSPAAGDLALINYTSGSMGFSKGVMLSYDNLWSNVQYSIDGLDFLKPGDTMLSMLPMAHMYGLMIEVIHPFVKGCHIFFLNRTPSPKVIMEAFAEVRPKLVVAVPLIIEKIVRTRIFPLLDKPLMKVLLHLPFVDSHLLAKVKKGLADAFGGNLLELIIGGAPLSKDVETFLRKIQFPYTVGYGMTECGPLVAYAPWDIQRPASCGKIVPRMEARIDSPDPANVPGVLWVRGRNVMKGYYRNDEATKAVFDADGWMNTGDICQIDADGFVYIRGRDKNMILGPSGQNIYPEEIEVKLSTMPYVAECLVVDRGGRLTALVVPDLDLAQRQKVGDSELSDIMKQDITALNHDLPSYSQISDVEIMKEEFEKTPKRSIKRYLYK